jgi:hypothetical protein
MDDDCGSLKSRSVFGQATRATRAANMVLYIGLPGALESENSGPILNLCLSMCLSKVGGDVIAIDSLLQILNRNCDEDQASRLGWLII